MSNSIVLYNRQTRFCFCFALPYRKKHRPSQSTADVYSFYEVRKLKIVQTISQDAIIEKLLPLTVYEKIVLVPLMNIFEHD